MKKLLVVLLLAAAVAFLVLDDGGTGTPVRPVLSAPTSALVGEVRTSFDHPDPTRAQLDRRARTAARVEQLGVPYNANLPHVESRLTARPRRPLEVAKRSYCLAACAVKGETQHHPIGSELVEQFGVRESLTPRERGFIADPTPTMQEFIDHSWGYECSYVLLWAAGGVDTLPPPDTVCDAAVLGGTLKGLESPENVAATRAPRPLEDVLDALDLYYNLQWASTELRVRGTSTEAIDPSVVVERLRALNWLVGHLGLEWDDVRADA